MAQNLNSKARTNHKYSSLQSQSILKYSSTPLDDDDFQENPSASLSSFPKTSSKQPLSNPKRPKKPKTSMPGKENRVPVDKIGSELGLECGLDAIEPSLDLLKADKGNGFLSNCNSVESRLLKPRSDLASDYVHDNENDGDEDVDGEVGFSDDGEEFDDGGFLEEGATDLDVLLKLCDEGDEPACDAVMGFVEAERSEMGDGSSCCPLCGADLSWLSEDLMQAHANECLDKVENLAGVGASTDDKAYQCPGQVLDGSPFRSPKKVVDVSPVLEWLKNLGLAKYEEVFVREEIDWAALKCLTEEDLYSIGVTALGPRKKIIHALQELRKDAIPTEAMKTDASKTALDGTKTGTSKLITDYFPCPVTGRKREISNSNGQNESRRNQPDSAQRSLRRKSSVRNGKQKDIPVWCCVPGTPFRVDAFKYLRRDCSHWFLTHFHLDHYQGLTRSFSHGMIYCSLITAKLINMKIGIPWDKIQVLPLNEKINIAGVSITCFDANHCPGAIIILFEPPSGKAVLHTGDFRFNEEMTKIPSLQSCFVHSLILDTTYCDPQYDFPKQDAVIQFVIDAIQAESFNPKTLFLIGSYSIGKERVFIEVARALSKKIYVNAAKLRMLKCLGLPEADMKWFTTKEQDSQIHVVPLWSIASVKRLKQMSNQYMGRYNLIVAFSPTGWSFGKGKKPGKRWQQGTIIRYEVPYSEHSSFTELKEFVKFVSPAHIIPSVNNYGPDSQNAMVTRLLT